MSGYESSIINLIADNLRDRYDSGFPVIKELVQNADDAQATRIVFGQHPGFPHDTDHPLTTGPALWFFNNGRFKPDDREAIRSFGINSKAGDASTIGKFGLGMKSVFHLGEAFLYLGFSGSGDVVREIINPWDNKRPDHLHSDWNDVSEVVWQTLEQQVATLKQPADASGFFLWLPLRTHALLDGKGPIIRCFPGEPDSKELDFLREQSLAGRLAAVLAMLPHLEEINFSDPTYGFHLKLQQSDGGNRLALGRENAPEESASLVIGAHQKLKVAARHRPSEDSVEPFAGFRNSPAWPRSFYRNPVTGFEEIAKDKSRAEGAVIVSHIDGDVGQLTMEWAVFLPLGEPSIVRIPNSSRHYRITLHGQFFVDAGRKGMVGLDNWFQVADQSADSSSESALRNGWNRALVEQVVLPLLLPALEHYTQAYAVKDTDTRQLTQALKDWINQLRHKLPQGKLLSLICQKRSWVRILTARGGAWSLVSDAVTLLPMPAPPASEPQRPWEIFSALDEHGTVIDADAPDVSESSLQWGERETLAAVQSIQVDALFSKAGFDYLGHWFGMRLTGRLPYCRNREVQTAMVRVLRTGLQRGGLGKVRRFARSFSNALSALDEQRCIGLGARDTSSATSVPDAVFQALWSVDSDLLLVPQDLFIQGSNAKPREHDLFRWLEAVQPLLNDRSLGVATMTTCRELLNTLDPASRKSFLEQNKDIRVIAARNVRTGRDEPLSWRQIEEFREQHALFAAGSATPAASNLLKMLSESIPNQLLFQLTRENQDTVFGPETRLPSPDDAAGILLCVAASGSSFGAIEARRNLINSLNLPAWSAVDGARWTKIRGGMRYLLHGERAHRYSDDPLWVRDPHTSLAWKKLWGQLQTVEPWQILDDSISDLLKSGDLPRLNVRRIDRNEAIKYLSETEPARLDPASFSREERAEILGVIQDKALWCKLPLHEFADRTFGHIDEGGYLPGDVELPTDLAGKVRLLMEASDPALSQQQRNWVPELSSVVIARIALDSAAPHKHWRLLLDVLGGGDLELEAVLRRTPWLPLSSGKAAEPGNVIHVPDLEDELERLASETGYRFTTVKGLCSSLREHPRLPQLRDTIVPQGKASFETLVRMLVELPSYSVGTFPREAIDEINKALPALCKVQRLHAWRLLATVAAGLDDTVWNVLLEHSTVPLEPQVLVDVLNELAGSSEPAALAAHRLYLKSFNANPGCDRSHVAKLKLRTLDGAWVPAEGLCADATGIRRQYLLDKEQAIALRDKVFSAAGVQGERDAANPVDLARLDTLRKATPGLAESYFRGWDARTKGSAVGSFLATLGSSLEQIARDYLRPQSLEHTRQKLCDYSSEQGRWPDCSVLGQSIETVKVVVTVVTDAKVEAHNLLGDLQAFPVEQDPEQIVVGAPRRIKDWRGQGLGFLVQLAPRDLYERMDGHQLSETLRRSTRFILTTIHKAKHDNVDALWNELNGSDQLELAIVRQKILDHLPPYLRQLGAHREKPVKEKLNLLNEAHNRKTEAEVQKESQSARDKASNLYRRRSLELAECLDTDPDAHRIVLSQLRRKLEEFQYERDGVLFELFQNADDAAVELGRCETLGAEIEIPEPARRFVIETNGSHVRVLHWGRLINYRGPSNLPDRWSGFGDDLEKMLILSASDKPDDETVTGRFGLGFKSVFLVCDKPRIVSGDLQVEICGGILPKPWSDAGRAIELLNKYAQDRLYRGTLIELAVDHGNLADVVGRFARYAGLVAVFSRALRSVHLDMKDGNRVIDWLPMKPVEGVEVGETNIPGTPSQISRLLVLRAKNGAVALKLGAHGCEVIESEVAPVWVTVPTRESDQIGFVINGAFQLDAGRGRLAGNQSSNVLMMREIGREIGERLYYLLQAHDDPNTWASRRAELGLVMDCTPAQFLASIWQTLSKRTLAGAESSDLQKLAGELVIEAFVGWCERGGPIPNGLPGTFSALVPTGRELRQLPDTWSGVDVLRRLWEVPGFSAASVHLTSRFMANLLRKSGLQATIPSFDLDSLVVSVCTNEQCGPEVAAALERFMAELERNDSTAQISFKSGSKLRFKVENGRWCPPQDVLCASDMPEHADEKLRFDFAPEANRLDRAYSREAIAFFMRCRERMQAPTETLVRWALDCKDNTRRAAALRYIGEGQLCREVADSIRKSNDRGWISDITSRQHPLVASFGPELSTAIWRLLAPEAVFAEPWQPTPTLSTHSYRGPDALVRIQQWWERESGEHRQRYLNHLYPDGRLTGLSLGSGSVNRKPWMTLFGLGAFQRLGRVRSYQTRGFIQYMQRKGWWEVICESHPEEHGDKWLEILKQFAEDRQGGQEYDHWLDAFPRLYQLAYWLDQYVDLFEGINCRSGQQLDPDLFLKPYSDPSLQGGGWGAPAIDRTMKIGVHLVVRELLRHKVIVNPVAHHLAYMPVNRVLQLFDAIGIHLPEESNKGIWKVLSDELGEDGAIFGGDFDIPLLVLAEDNDLLMEVCSASILDDDPEVFEVFA